MKNLMKLTQGYLLQCGLFIALISENGISNATPICNAANLNDLNNHNMHSDLGNGRLIVLFENHSPYDLAYIAITARNGGMLVNPTGVIPSYLNNANNSMYTAVVGSDVSTMWLSYASNYTVGIFYHGVMISDYVVAKDLTYTTGNTGDLNTCFNYYSLNTSTGDYDIVNHPQHPEIPYLFACHGGASSDPNYSMPVMVYAEINPYPDAPPPIPPNNISQVAIVGDQGTILFSPLGAGNFTQAVNETSDMQKTNFATVGYGQTNQGLGWVVAGENKIFYKNDQVNRPQWNEATINLQTPAQLSNLIISKVLWHKNFIGQSYWTALASINGSRIVLQSTDASNWSQLFYTSNNYSWPNISDLAVTNTDGWVAPAANTFIAGTDMNPDVWISHDLSSVASDVSLKAVASAVGSSVLADPMNNSWYGAGGTGSEGVVITSESDFTGMAPNNFANSPTNINNNVLTQKNITYISGVTDLNSIATRRDPTVDSQDNITAYHTTWAALGEAVGGGSAIVSNYPNSAQPTVIKIPEQLNSMVLTNDLSNEPTSSNSGYFITVGNKGVLYFNAEFNSGQLHQFARAWQPQVICLGNTQVTANLNSIAWNGGTQNSANMFKALRVASRNFVDNHGALIKSNPCADIQV